VNLEEFDFSVFDHTDKGFNPEMRKNGLTGSDVAAILGKHYRRTAWDVYAVKTGLVTQPFEESEAMELGTAFQLPVCAIYQKRSNNPVRWSDVTVQHPEHPWMVATPDGYLRQPLLDGRTGVYEGKTAGSKMLPKWGEEWTDEVPDEYLIQGIWNCMVTGNDFCDYAVLLGGQPLAVRCYRVEPDETLKSKLFEAAKNFWFNNVVARVAPEIQSSKLADLFLARYDSTEDFRDATEEEIALLKELCEFYEGDIKNPKREEDIKTQLKARIGDHAGLVGPWGVVRHKRNKDTVTVNYEGVVEELKSNVEASLMEQIIANNTKTRRGARPLVPKFNPGAFKESI
jgi:putative phage-type endonuclease